MNTRHRGKGVDILSKGKAIEVAVTPSDIYSSVKQLKRSRAFAKYIAVPTKQVPLARKLLTKTGIGVMNLLGKVQKRTRKRKGR